MKFKSRHCGYIPSDVVLGSETDTCTVTSYEYNDAAGVTDVDYSVEAATEDDGLSQACKASNQVEGWNWMNAFKGAVARLKK